MDEQRREPDEHAVEPGSEGAPPPPDATWVHRDKEWALSETSLGDEGPGGFEESARRLREADLFRLAPEGFDFGRTKQSLVVRQHVRRVLHDSWVRFLISIPLAIVGLTFLLLALTIGSTFLIVGTVVLVPTTWWWCGLRYQRWLDHKRFGYRLLESLGEDVSDWDPYPRRRYRHAHADDEN